MKPSTTVIIFGFFGYRLGFNWDHLIVYSKSNRNKNYSKAMSDCTLFPSWPPPASLTSGSRHIPRPYSSLILNPSDSPGPWSFICFTSRPLIMMLTTTVDRFNPSERFWTRLASLWFCSLLMSKLASTIQATPWAIWCTEIIIGARESKHCAVNFQLWMYGTAGSSPKFILIMSQKRAVTTKANEKWLRMLATRCWTSPLWKLTSVSMTANRAAETCKWGC